MHYFQRSFDTMLYTFYEHMNWLTHEVGRLEYTPQDTDDFHAALSVAERLKTVADVINKAQEALQANIELVTGNPLMSADEADAFAREVMQDIQALGSLPNTEPPSVDDSGIWG